MAPCAYVYLDKFQLYIEVGVPGQVKHNLIWKILWIIKQLAQIYKYIMALATRLSQTQFGFVHII